MVMFTDRTQAGQRLAAALLHLKDRAPVILALPRGGVVVGWEVARALGAPLDLVLVRKIGAPGQPELAAAAVVDGEEPEMVVNDDVVGTFAVPATYLEQERARQVQEIERRRGLYLGGRARAEIGDRTAVVVDDGIATGATVRVALRAVRRRKPARTVLAVPVAPPDTIEALRSEADEIVCLETPALFGAISAFYADVRQVTDDEVTALLARTAGSAGG